MSLSNGIEGTYEEEVDTSKLLTSLENNSERGTVSHTGTCEDLVPLCVRHSSLFVKLLLDIGDLAVDARSIRFKTSQTSNGVSSFLLTTLSVGISGTLRKEQNTSTEDQRPQEGETIGDSPRCRVGLGFGTPVDHLSSPDTKRDEELICRNEDTSNDGGRTLTLVHGNHDRKRSNSKTCNKSTDGELNPMRRRRDFDDGTDAG